MYWFKTVSDRRNVILCGCQDFKIQVLQTNQLTPYLLAALV